MTARESVKNYPSALREMTNYSVRGIKKICKESGAHPAGSEGEKKTQLVLKQELTECCDEVHEEKFKAKPNTTAFLIAGSLLLAAAITLFALKQFIVGGCFAILAVVVFVFSFLVKKPEAVNLYAIKKPTGNAVRRIVLLANSDSSKKSEGAGNNLSSCYAALSVVRFMQRQKLNFQNTEVWIVLTDADNINLSGTKYFAENHSFSDIETVFISLSCLINPDELSAFFADEKSRDLIECAAKTADKKLLEAQSTQQSKIIAKSNVHYASLSAFTKDDLKNEDTADTLNLRAIEKCVDLLLETSFAFDN